MIIIIIKFIHYLAIVFSGGVLVGSGLIQSVYNKENKVPDITISNILKILGFIGLISLIVLWISGIILGLMAGPNQSCSRSLMASLTPKERQSEFFGFFASSTGIDSVLIFIICFSSKLSS